MKTKHRLLLATTTLWIAIQFTVQPAVALNAISCQATACSGMDTTLPGNTIRNCGDYTDNCYYNLGKIRTCNICNIGYTRTKQTMTAGTCTITYYSCESNSSGGGGDIGGDITKSCKTGEYLDTSTTQIGGTCTDCPSPGTSDGGSGDITDCYVYPNISYSDVSGTYIYTNRCYYTNRIIIDL